MAIGLVTSLLLGGVPQSLLYGVGPRDPVTLVGTPILTPVIALAAALVPALRAARVDPIISMRAE